MPHLAHIIAAECLSPQLQSADSMAKSLERRLKRASLVVMLQVYVWGRRHPYVHLNFLGLFNFTAPYLPWVLLAFSVTLRSNAVVDLLGIVAGMSSYPVTSYQQKHICIPKGRAQDPRPP